MKKDDIRLLRIKAQKLGIKYVSKYNKQQLTAMIAKKDPEFMIKAIFGEEELTHTHVIRVPRGVTNLNLKIETV